MIMNSRIDFMMGFSLSGGADLIHASYEGLTSNIPPHIRRLILMRRADNFNTFNHKGLISNCSSFARYLYTGQKSSLILRRNEPEKVSDYYKWNRTLYLYKGGYVAVGDVIVIFYSNKEITKHVKVNSLMSITERADERLLRSAEANDQLRHIGISQRNISEEEYSLEEQFETLSCYTLVREYHFLICIGHREVDGVVIPIFISQAGKNIDGDNLVKPPFADIRITRFEPFAASEEDPALLVFISRRDTLPNPW